MNRVLNWGVVFLVVSFCIFPLGANAQDTDDAVGQGDTPQKKVTLDDLTIRATPNEELFSAELGNFGHPVFVVTGEQIQKAGFVDLARAVEAMVPGFFSNARQGRGGWTFNYLHGSDEFLWLLDGVRINNPLYGSDWSTTISIHNIDRIEVLKGGESLFYGTGARAGVINIITKSVTDSLSGEFGTSYGELSYREVYGHVSETVNGHGLMAFGSYEASDGYQVCNDQSYEDALYTDKKHEVGYDRSAVGLKYRKDVDWAGKAVLRAQVQKHQGKFDYPYPMYRTAYNDWEEEIYTLKWDHDINPNFSYFLKSYFHRWWGEVTFTNEDGSYSWGYDKSNQSLWGYEDYGASLITSTRWGTAQEMIVGLDYESYWGKEVVVSVPRTERVHNYAVFANYRPYIPFAPKVRTAIGGRYTTTSEDQDKTVWEFSLKTPIYGNTYLRGLTGTSFTLPTLLQLHGDDPTGGKYGNPDLKPEESMNIEAGIGGQWRYVNFDAGYFHQDVQDLIAQTTLDNGDVTYKNISGTTEISGIELQAGIGPFAGVSFSTSATWVSAVDKETDDQLERIPEFYGKANIRYRHSSERYGADLMCRYIGYIYERELSPYEDQNFGDYYVADVSFFWRFGKQLHHRFTVRMENIFDETYETQYNRARNSNGDYFLYHQDGLPRNIVVGYLYSF